MAPQNEHEFRTDAARWQAVVRRDRRASGAFVYGVLTTLVYCRPACASRLPRYENVRFFDTPGHAEKAGFRPCKRCRPQADVQPDRHAAAIAKACGIIEIAESPPPLGELARAVGLSPYHFQRLFKKTLGITPKQYAMQKRLTRVRARLRKDISVTAALYDAGYASGSRFYDQVGETLGMKPSEYRRGAEGIKVRFAVARSSLGWVLVAATPKGICAIDIGESPESLTDGLHKRFPKADVQDGGPAFRFWVEQVLAHIEMPRQALDLPLDIQGTAFQRLVWSALREIPPGSTRSYADIAIQIGRPHAARAVARACAANRIALAVPCHRAVRRDGSLGGYRWGIERKQSLLKREAGQPPSHPATDSPPADPLPDAVQPATDGTASGRTAKCTT